MSTYSAEKATLESNRTEDWQAIMEFCDHANRAGDSERGEIVRAIASRLSHRSEAVAIQTISVR